MIFKKFEWRKKINNFFKLVNCGQLLINIKCEALIGIFKGIFGKNNFKWDYILKPTLFFNFFEKYNYL